MHQSASFFSVPTCALSIPDETPFLISKGTIDTGLATDQMDPSPLRPQTTRVTLYKLIRFPKMDGKVAQSIRIRESKVRAWARWEPASE